MKKVIFGVIMVFGVSMGSFASDIGRAKFFIGAACEDRTTSQAINSYIMGKVVNGLTNEIVDTLEQEVNKQKGCSFLYNENIKFNIFKKLEDKMQFYKGGEKVLTHSALVTIHSINGKTLKQLSKNNEIGKILSSKKLWISRPYFNEKIKQALPLFTLNNGTAW